MMKAAIFGTRIVGADTGVCVAGTGNDVVCMAIDKTTVEHVKCAEITMFEPNQESTVTHNHSGRQLDFTTAATAIAHRKIIFIAAETSYDQRGSL